jgi:hypothetical protein
MGAKTSHAQHPNAAHVANGIKEITPQTRIVSLDYFIFLEFPTEILDFPNIEELYLSNCMLESIPESIVKLRNLKKLYINNNQLTALPPNIGKLEKLEEISFENNQSSYYGNNQIKEFPASFFKLRALKQVRAFGNPIQIIPPAIRNLDSLTHFYSSGTIPLEIVHCSQLQQLNPYRYHLPDSLKNIFCEYAKKYDLPLSPLLRYKVPDKDAKHIEEVFNFSGGAPEYQIPLFVPRFIYKAKYKKSPSAYAKKNGSSFPVVDMAWAAVCNRDPKFAIKIIKEYNICEDSYEARSGFVILICAYILNNEWEKAEPLMVKYRYERNHSYSKVVLFRDQVMGALLRLDSNGVKHKDFERAKKLLK